MAELDTSEREALLKVSRKVHRHSFIPVFFQKLEKLGWNWASNKFKYYKLTLAHQYGSFLQSMFQPHLLRYLSNGEYRNTMHLPIALGGIIFDLHSPFFFTWSRRETFSVLILYRPMKPKSQRSVHESSTFAITWTRCRTRRRHSMRDCVPTTRPLDGSRLR